MVPGCHTKYKAVQGGQDSAPQTAKSRMTAAQAAQLLLALLRWPGCRSDDILTGSASCSSSRTQNGYV